MKLPQKNSLALGILALMLIATSNCGGQPASKNTAEGIDNSMNADRSRRDDGMAVDGLQGTLPKEDVVKVFDRHMEKLLGCYTSALDELEEIEGHVVLALQVDPGGNVKHVHIKQSDLGSLEAEQCIERHVAKYTFPKPIGGTADVTYSMDLEAPYDPPPPLRWESPVIKAILEEHGDAVGRCIGNRTGIQITSYIGNGGIVLTSGASALEDKNMEASRCLAEDLRSWEFPDPGQKLGKVELTF